MSILQRVEIMTISNRVTRVKVVDDTQNLFQILLSRLNLYKNFNLFDDTKLIQKLNVALSISKKYSSNLVASKLHFTYLNDTD